MKEFKKVMFAIFLIVVIIAGVLIGYVIIFNNYIGDISEYSNHNCKYVVFFNRYNKDGSNRKNLVFYYDEYMNLIYKENFKAEDKVPNQIMINNAIYSYGYGGIFKTDILEKKTTALNTETSINIVKYDELGNVYAYQNFGFERGDSGKYNSKILKNNLEYLQLEHPVVDFCIYKDVLYVTTYNDISMQEGKIGIYENQKLIKQYDVNLSNGEGSWAVCDNNVCFLMTNSALRIDGIEIKEIEFEGINEKLLMPRVTHSADFNNLYINSTKVQYKDNKMIFTDTDAKDYTNYNPKKDEVLDCYFNKKEQTLKLKENLVVIDNNNKYNYVFLSAFEF